MPKYLVKRALWLVIVVVVLVGIWQSFVGVANLSVYFQHGANPASALNIVPNVPPDLSVGLTWTADDTDTGRVLERATRTEIESVYLRAWLQWNLSFVKNAPYGLKTYFVGPALDAVTNDVQTIAIQGWQVGQVDTAHTLHLHFYSADGSIISFTDEQAVVVHIIRDKTGAIVLTQESEARYQVVMLLEDGNWRVRHWVRTQDTVLDGASAVRTPPNFVGRVGANLALNGQNYSMTGVNYYPKDTPWDKFWLNYAPKTTERDVTLIRSLGMNTVRIFLPFEQFGGPHIGQATSATVPTNTVREPLVKLADFLRRAAAHGLKVIVTLFDFRTDYSLLLWPQSDRYLETLLTHFKDTPTILAWDIKNEPDLDYKNNGKEVVNAWLAHTARLARRTDPHHLLTIGWSTYKAAETQVAAIDVVSFHYYAPATALPQAYTVLQSAVFGRPILLTEFGLSTWNSPFFPGGHNEAEQAAYYADILHFWRTSGGAGYLAWTLYDFSTIPANVVGGLPWQSGPQRGFGLIKSDGTFKAAARVLTQNGLDNTPPVSLWERTIKPFNGTLLVGVLLALQATMWVRRWRGRKRA